MVFLERRRVFWSIVLLALGGIVVASLMALSQKDSISNNSLAEQACKRIKVGMTKEQVTEILEGKTPDRFVIGGSLSHPIYMYEWEDGSSM